MENIENPFVNEGTKESLMELADANMKKTAEKEGKEADTLGRRNGCLGSQRRNVQDTSG